MNADHPWCCKILDVMDHAHAQYALSTSAPEKVQRPGHFIYQFREQTLEQAVIQKLARIVTGLRGAHRLIDLGYLQEGASLQRGVDEAQEDVHFLAYGKITGDLTADHHRYLKQFWSSMEEAKPFPRPKIRDYNSSIEAKANTVECDVVLQPMRQIYKMYSAYAHAHSTCVMEMYDGSPPEWKLKGNAGSRFQRDHQYDIRNQYFRGATSFAVSGLLFNRPDMFQGIVRLADSFLKATEEI